MAQKKGHQHQRLAATILPPDPTAPEATTLELAELWSVVVKKVKQPRVWLAIGRKTRQGVAYVIGDRSKATCRNLWRALPKAYRTGTGSTDFWSAYAAVIPDEQHEAVGKESGETAHIERFNTTIRHRLARFVRKTLSLSKASEMHDSCLRLFLWRYNMEIRNNWRDIMQAV